MARDSIASLIVRIGAQDQEIQKALASIGEKAKSLDVDLKKLGGTEIAGKATQSLNTLRNAMKEITQAQQAVADRATTMAQGLQVMGGASAVMTSQLKQVHKTLQEGLSAYKALGQEAPAALRSVATEVEQAATKTKSWGQTFLTVRNAIQGLLALKVVQWMKEGIAATVDYADTLDNLSVATGVSVQGLQRLEAIGATSNVSMETLARSVEQLQKHLDDPTALKAIADMGLSYAHIRSLKPEQQFLEIAQAVAAIEDPVAKQTAAVALFGKTWDQISPAIRGDLQAIADATTTMSDEQVAALDKAGDAWDRWYLDTSRRLKGFLGELVLTAQQSKLSWADILNPQVGPGKLAAGWVTGQFDVGAMPKVVAPPLRAGGGPVDLTLNERELAAVLRDTTAEIGKRGTAIQKAVDDQQRWNEKVADASGVTGGFQHDLDLLHFRMRHVADATLEADQRAIGYLGTLKQFLAANIPELPSRVIGGLSRGPVALPSKTFDASGGGLFSGLSRAQMAQMAMGGVGAMAGGGSAGSALSSMAMSAGTGVAISALTTSATLGSALALGAATLGIGAAAVGAYVAIKKLWNAGKEGREVSPLRDEFFKAAGGIEALNPKVLQLTGNLKAVEDVFKAKTVDDYKAALERLNAVLDVQRQAQDELSAAVQKYGFNIEELGPKFAQRRLNEGQGQLLKEYDLLIAAEIDRDTVLKRTAGSFQEVTTAALKSGATIAEELQGPIQRLIEMGLLVDENGNQLTDLSRLKFGALGSEFATLTKAINNLTRALGGAVDEAENLAQDRDFTIRGHVELPTEFPQDFPMPEGSSTGSIVRPWGLQHFARGGFARGTDTIHAMVSPGELIMNVAQQENVADALTANPPIEIHFHGPILAARDYAEKHLVEPILEGIRRYHKASFARLVNAVP